MLAGFRRLLDRLLVVLVFTAAALACGGAGGQLNQTSITCPPGRTLLDGVCVAESVADYVACVRATGAEVGGSSARKVSADVGTAGMHAAGAAELSETLARKYSASDAVALEVVRRCNAANALPPPPPPAPAAATGGGASTAPANAEAQSGWRWCDKCQQMFFGVPSPSGPCPAGGTHNREARSATYEVSWVSLGDRGQSSWRWCRKCQTLAFGGGGASVCAGGGAHDFSQSAQYSVHWASTSTNGQAEWRWCEKCGAMNFGPGGGGACPAGGAHSNAKSGEYRFVWH